MPLYTYIHKHTNIQIHTNKIHLPTPLKKKITILIGLFLKKTFTLMNAKSMKPKVKTRQCNTQRIHFLMPHGWYTVFIANFGLLHVISAPTATTTWVRNYQAASLTTLCYISFFSPYRQILVRFIVSPSQREEFVPTPSPI